MTTKEIHSLISQKEKCILKTSGDGALNFPVAFHRFSGEGITFYNGSDPEALKKWEGKTDGLIVTSLKFDRDLKNGPFLLVEHPRNTFVYLADQIIGKHISAGIHPTAVVHPQASIGEGTEIGAYAVVGKCSIGRNCRIGAQSFISDQADIGDDVNIFSNCVIGEPGLGSVIAYDEGQLLFPHIGKVIIKNKTVIGSGTHVNSGTLSDTVVGENTHISTKCLVAHNCIIGDGVYIAATANVAGSVKIGDKCYIGFGALISDGVELAGGVTVGAGATIMKSCLDKDVTLMNQPQIKNLGKLFSIKRQ